MQYYREARQHALCEVYPDLKLELAKGASRINYPRPLSEPPSPSSSRATTPAPSEHGSEEESVDSEGEVSSFLYNLIALKIEIALFRQFIYFY